SAWRMPYGSICSPTIKLPADALFKKTTQFLTATSPLESLFPWERQDARGVLAPALPHARQGK
ncbi:MAG: hypothetical protein RSF79_21480, partial [Janthinobacterium sp.]